MWLTWSELVNSQRITAEHFKNLLAQYPKSSILIACAKISVCFKFGPDALTVPDDAVADLHIPILFPPALVPAVRWWLHKEKRFPFFNAQLRYLAAETIRMQVESPVAEIPTNGPQNDQFGELMLKSGELLYQPHVIVEDELDGYANIVAEFLPSFEFGLKNDPLFTFLRFYIWLTVIIPRIPPQLLKFDLQTEFGKLFPFQIITYAEFIAAFALHALLERQNQTYDKPVDAALRKRWFNNSSLPPRMIEDMFDTVSFSLDKMPEPKETLGYGDFEFLKDRPYFAYNDELFMLDYEYALGKLESAVVWRVLRNLPKNKKDPWLSYWGLVFQEYVTWMIETYASPSLHVLHPNPVYVDSTDEICDQVVICGETAILIEAKLATMTAADRISANYEKVKEYLEKKLVEDKGVNQLLNTIKRIGVKGDDIPAYLKGVKKIIPVIMTKDEVGSCWGINAYLNKRFKDQLSPKSHKGIIVTPLVCLSISSFERMAWGIAGNTLADILQERIEDDPTLRKPFDAASAYPREGMPQKLHAHVDAYQELTERLIKDFDIKEEQVPEPPASS
jgi:hypothetical protein